MKRPLIAMVALATACTRLPAPMPAGDTPYAREQIELARAAPPVRPHDEARALRDAAAALEPSAVEARRGIEAAEEAEGLLDLAAPGAREVVAKVRDRETGEAFLSAAPLDLETVLLATYARNPDVEAARATWRSTVRLYDQATYLEDVLLRYRAFARFATTPVASKAMGEAAFPYPGVVALKGAMIAAEVRMAREDTRMRLRDALASAAMAYVEAAAREEEARQRAELVGLADRMLTAARARVRTGTATQAELLEAEAERAMLENDRVQTLAAESEAKARLNTLLARDPTAPISLRPLSDPPAETPALAPLLALAERFAPEPRMARAESERTAIAIRMAEAMLFAVPPPGALAGLGMSRDASTSMGPATDRAPVGPRTAAGGGMGTAMTSGARAAGGSETASAGDSMPPSGESASTAPAPAVPAALGADLAWVAELRERRVSLDRKVEEASRTAARRVVEAHLALDTARRMYALTVAKTIPLATQAVEERMRLYESGRATFSEVFESLRRVVEARLGAVSARRMYAEAEAKTWMAAGARPSVVERMNPTGGGR